MANPINILRRVTTPLGECSDDVKYWRHLRRAYVLMRDNYQALKESDPTFKFLVRVVAASGKGMEVGKTKDELTAISRKINKAISCLSKEALREIRRKSL